MSIEKYGFFDSTSDDVREYTGADWLRFSRLVSPNGVRSENDLKISASVTGLSVRAGYGLAMVDGQQYELYDDGGGAKELSFTAPTSTARIDRVVLRLDRNARTIAMVIKQGSTGAPTLERTDAIYEISLAQVRVPVGAESISESDITDERSDKTLCGVLQGLTAGEAYTLAQRAQETANAAQSAANAAQSKANSAQSAAENAQRTADAAKEKATGAHYWAAGPISISTGTDGWTYDNANDRYYQDFAVSGMTAEMIPFASSDKTGGNFPLCGCMSASGSIRLYMTDTPQVSGTVIVYGLEARE